MIAPTTSPLLPYLKHIFLLFVHLRQLVALPRVLRSHKVLKTFLYVAPTTSPSPPLRPSHLLSSDFIIVSYYTIYIVYCNVYFFIKSFHTLVKERRHRNAYIGVIFRSLTIHSPSHIGSHVLVSQVKKNIVILCPVNNVLSICVCNSRCKCWLKYIKN